MKKIILSILIYIILPINILAYSNYIIPGGETIGIDVYNKGLTVVGFYKVDNKYIASNSFKVGDTIIKINNKDVTSINEMTKIIDSIKNTNNIKVLIKRNNKQKEVNLTLIKEDNLYKTGLYIKEKVTGIGTLTYIDPITKIYGSLGHEILMSESTNSIEVRKGSIYTSFVNSIDRSINGRVGSKNASIDYTSTIGTVTKNTPVGIFGIYKEELEKDTLEVSTFDEITLSKAYIQTTLTNNTLNQYEIEILSKNKSAINTNKAISFIVTDKELLEQTGGIVQGMSGSPIIQNNKIIGAVTHVVIDDVVKGYAVFIQTMLEEGER